MATSREMGPFEVLESLGAGGMGEVFKARDKRLNRFVAIKFLPPGAGEAARERFQREALAIAALNHPHICTLYEVGDDGGRPYLVLELLEGETLKARLRRGAVDADQLLDWSVQISDALDAAHRKGVLHRDLKPDNIWVGPSGHIKVLDFGLARLEGEACGNEATVLTSPGVPMGTVPYMSPEQARGEMLDARSDIFSFGSVFYEMASGRPAFPAANAADSIAAVLRGQPKKLSAVRPEISPFVEQVAERCLEKEPDLRYQSAADLRGELKRLKRESVSGSSPAAATGASSRPRGWIWVTVAAVCVLAAGAIGYWQMGRARPEPVPRLSFRQLTFTGNVVNAVISPDGKFLAHIDQGPEGTSLHLMSVANGSDAQIVPPAAGCCASPSFSPDGSQVYFLEGRVLKAVPVLGGTMETIADPACSGAGFSPDGNRIAYVADVQEQTAIMLARADGSGAKSLHVAPPDSGYLSECYGAPGALTHPPTWSADGAWLLLTRFVQPKNGYLELVATSNGGVRDITALSGGSSTVDANWSPDGHRILFTGSIPIGSVTQIWSADVKTGKLAQLTNDLQGYLSLSVATNGELAVVHASPQYSIWVRNRTGGDFQEVRGGGADQDGADGLTWTSGGQLLSRRILGNEEQLWQEDSDGNNARVLVRSLPNGPAGVVAAPNGTIFLNVHQGSTSIWSANADGTNIRDLARPGAGEQAFYPVVVSGGQAVAYLHLDAQGRQTLWEMRPNGSDPHQIWSGMVYLQGNPASPDGSRIFAIAKGGANATHVPVVVRVDGATPQVTRIGMDFKTMPGPYDWTPDGRAITYIVHQGSVDNIWAFPLAGGKPYAVTQFKALNIAAYAFSKDGRLAVSRGSQNSDAVLATGLVNHGH